MKDIYANYHTETIEGFEVRLRFEDEGLSPQEVFDINEEYGKKDIQAIYDGKLTWLFAIVEVFKCGVKLSYTTLGAITYKWHKLDEFIKEEFYHMAQEAISEARLKLEELRAA